MMFSNKDTGAFRLTFRWALLAVAGVAVLLTAFTVFLPVLYQGEPDDFLTGQSAALRPGFRSGAGELRSAPRYTLTARVDPEAASVQGRLHLRYTNTTSRPLESLVFRLYPNADSIYGGGSLEVSGILRDGAAAASTLSQDGTVLSLPLQPALAPEEATTVEMDFAAHIPSSQAEGYGIFSSLKGVISLSGWYPLLAAPLDGWQTPAVPRVGDVLFAETSFYEVYLTAPEGLSLAATGSVTGEELSEDGWVTWHSVSGPVREFAAFLSSEYRLVERRVDGVQLRLYTLPAGEANYSPQVGLDILSTAFAALQDRFGPYPFTEFEMVEGPVSIGGYEFSGMAVIDDSYRLDRSRADYEYIIAHELAHQWWYGLVGNPTVDHPWLDEAHATYAGVLYNEWAKGAEAGRSLVNRWKANEGLPEPGDPPVNSSALEFTSWAPYREAVYIHGALFLDELRQQIGDERFFEMLRSFQEQHRYRIATTADYLQHAETAAGREMDDFYQQWFQGAAGDE